MAVYKNADLLRASIVSASNSHRLGANEAPPAIISVFLGTRLTEMFNEIEEKVSSRKMTPDEKTELKLDIGKIPEILLDNTDRNRTSPFAFTGNRFEFRAVGSSANCAAPMTIVNTAVADQLVIFKKEVDAVIAKGVKKDEAIFQILRKYIIECKPVRFDGNNYSEEWVKEARKRGLTNINDVPEALDAYVDKKSIDLFKRQGVFTKKLQIEARVLGDLVQNHIVPIAIKYQTSLIDNVKGLKEVFCDAEYKELAGARLELIREISQHISYIKAKVKEMVEARKVANKIEDTRKKADAYSKKVKPFLDDIRYHIDKLELIVDNEMWPLPKYRELLFTR
jgi:glutamine synthetase